ncbi:hypothetical protein MRX96_028112 [Rhipicephalus microplus]
MPLDRSPSRRGGSVVRRQRRLAAASASGENKCRSCCRKFAAFLFSHVGLCALVVGYSVLGAFAFRALEGPYEVRKASQVRALREQTVSRLWEVTAELNVLYKDNWTFAVNEHIRDFQLRLVAAVKDGYDGKESGREQQWSFSGAFLYSLTVITTIEKERVYEVQHASDDFEVRNVASSCASRKRDWRVNACVGGKYIPFRVDTGSQANVLPLSMFRKLKTTTLMPSSDVLRSYGGNTIKHIGKFSALIEIGGRKACAEFFVVKKDHSTILGFDTSEKLGIVQRAVASVMTNDTEEIVKEVPRLFHGTGCAPRLLTSHQKAVAVDRCTSASAPCHLRLREVTISSIVTSPTTKATNGPLHRIYRPVGGGTLSKRLTVPRYGFALHGAADITPESGGRGQVHKRKRTVSSTPTRGLQQQHRDVTCYQSYKQTPSSYLPSSRRGNAQQATNCSMLLICAA